MRKRFKKVGFNTKLIVDVVGASLIVQQAPKLIDMIVPLDPTIRAIAGVGAGYLAGSMLNRPDLANASIALGAVEFIAPMVENIFGGSTPMLPPAGGTKAVPMTNAQKLVKVEDFLSLNEYVNTPNFNQQYIDYAGSY